MADAASMSPESVAPVMVPNVSAAGIASLDAARIDRSEAPAGELLELRRKLDTERSAGKAVLASVLELDRRLQAERESVLELDCRLQAERESAESLQAAADELDSALEEERREQQTQRVEVQRLWGEIRVLEAELREAERPLWRKLLRRP
ncbi:hypothetical protein BH20ACT19_BH20ACT19_09990 [soil metagenome]